MPSPYRSARNSTIVSGSSPNRSRSTIRSRISRASCAFESLTDCPSPNRTGHFFGYFPHPLLVRVLSGRCAGR